MAALLRARHARPSRIATAGRLSSAEDLPAVVPPVPRRRVGVVPPPAPLFALEIIAMVDSRAATRPDAARRESAALTPFDARLAVA